LQKEKTLNILSVELEKHKEAYMKYALIAIGVLVVLVLIFFANQGLFYSPKFSKKKVETMRLVFNEHIGPYQGTKAVMDKVYDDLLAINISTTKGFGIYFDNPQITPKEELRSYAGCIVDTKDCGLLNEENKPAQVMDFPEQECLVSEFPFKGPMSVIFGIMKVYPELNKRRTDVNGENLPVFEIYDVPSKKIIYVALLKELELQQAFEVVEPGEDVEDGSSEEG